MEQLVQNLKDGEMFLAEVPFPALNSGCILVRNHFSMISAGTEGKTVKDARLGYIGKARARKDEVKKVINTARTAGVMQTYRMVMNKLEALSSLGYCCSGEVIEVAPDITDIKIGDWVACGGATANHAEVIAVPRNLCVKVPGNIKMETACLTTMGSIALQGIRQADLRLGESCAVIGLGLLGQLTMQLLNASGIKSIGIDIDAHQVQAATSNGLSAINRSSEFLENTIEQLTNGYGVDAVIITAGTNSTDPVDLAGEICRQKGKVIVVGAVPTGFSRNNYFRKELDLRMSCSYGPGRYDTTYEEKGVDYPIGYVRWTENRNMQAFLDLAAAAKIEPEKLISHSFNFENCTEAYEMVLNKQEPFLGIVLKYDIEKKLKHHAISIQSKSNSIKSENPVAGLIGAGSFAKNILIPALKNNVILKGIATSKPHEAKDVASKYGFEYCTGNNEEILNNPEINTLFIASRHNSHFNLVMEGLQNNKHVFVEKPLCLLEEQLEIIRDAYIKSNKKLMVGFNRRFSPLVQELKSTLATNQNLPIAINYRINAGVVPKTHWIHDKTTGGGRIIGEVCHFIDLAMFLAGSAIVSVSAFDMADENNQDDTLVINLSFKNGSIATIAYFSNGNTSLKKELLEVFYSKQIAIIDDFNSLKISGKQTVEKKVNGQDKGHRNEITAFATSIREGLPAPIPFDEIYLSTLATFKVLESIKEKGARIFLD